ncbi:MAG: ABC transporter substrate-binding protein [Xanthobacteraceae bacterium]
MRRREFIRLLAIAGVPWPLVARAQQQALAVPVIGILRSTPAEPSQVLIAAFRAGLNEAGFAEDRNVRLELRYADNHADRLPGLVAELLRRQVAVIVANSIAAAAAKRETATTPIVFVTGEDPVMTGLVASLNRPGGNVTGVSFFTSRLSAKRMEILDELAPKNAPIVALVDSRSAEGEAESQDIEAAANALRRQIIVIRAGSASDFERAFTAVAETKAGGLLVGAGPLLTSGRRQLVAYAAHRRVVSVFSAREFVEMGGLISYATSLTGAYRQAAMTVARILRGERSADLPVQLPTKFELVINLTTAKALGLDVPPTLLALADDVIE